MKENTPERQLVAAMLLSPSSIGKVLRHITIEAMTDGRNKTLVEAMLWLRATRRRSNGRELGEHLSAKGLLDKVGGWSYLAGLNLELPDLKQLPQIAAAHRRVADSDGAFGYSCHRCGRPASCWSGPLAIRGHAHPARWPACAEHAGRNGDTATREDA